MMSAVNNFLVALGVSIFLVILFSILPDGNPSEAASILIQAFWLIIVLVRVIFSVIVVAITAVIFIVLSFLISGLNFLVHDIGGMEKISTVFLLDMQSDALGAVDVLYFGVMDFLDNFRISVQEIMGVTIVWDRNQTLGGGITVIAEQGDGIISDIISAGQDVIDDILNGLGIGVN